MGMDFGLPLPGGQSATCKWKFRWLFNIEGVSGESGSTKALPPTRAERPSLTFREMSIQHLNEVINIPAKPEWKPIQLVLYDLKTNGTHPVFKWIQEAYDPRRGTWDPIAENDFIKTANLVLYDGTGNEVERWVWEHAYPQQVEFGDLDMGSRELVVCTITLRYARAYVV